MRDIPLRELRNRTNDVLRDVERGEELVVTVSGRGVEQLLPLPRRPRFLPAQRLRTLELAAALEPLPVDSAVADAWAELRIALREQGMALPANGSWIAATAIAHGLPLVTQAKDYRDVPALRSVVV